MLFWMVPRAKNKMVFSYSTEFGINYIPYIKSITFLFNNIYRITMHSSQSTFIFHKFKLNLTFDWLWATALCTFVLPFKYSVNAKMNVNSDNLWRKLQTATRSPVEYRIPREVQQCELGCKDCFMKNLPSVLFKQDFLSPYWRVWHFSWNCIVLNAHMTSTQFFICYRLY